MRSYQQSPDRWYDSLDTLEDLRVFFSDVETVYVYTHHEIDLINGELKQSRSGPNWEGGLATLATCKHFLRTWKDFNPGVGIVGVTNKLDGYNFLLYAGIVERSFESNYDLGQYLKSIDPEVYKTKLMTNNRLGDIAEPVGKLTGSDRFESLNFHSPKEDHCRLIEMDSNGEQKWLKDIEYSTRSCKRPQTALLEPVMVSSRPELALRVKLGRTGRKVSGAELPSMFQEVMV